MLISEFKKVVSDVLAETLPRIRKADRNEFMALLVAELEENGLELEADYDDEEESEYSDDEEEIELD